MDAVGARPCALNRPFGGESFGGSIPENIFKFETTQISTQIHNIRLK